jgi:maleylpyruvate isomerase
VRLFGYWRSSSAWRVRIALAYKGIAHEQRPVNLVAGGGEQRSDAYRAKNPLEEVPTFELELDGQLRRISQSMAILDLLERLAPEPPLFPTDPFLRARALQLAEIVNAAIQPLQNLAVLERVQRELHGDPDAWARHFITRGLRALETLAKETARDFLIGDAPTIADVYLVPQLYNARRRDVDLAPYPTLTAVDAACTRLPAFQAAHPDRQPDAPAR